MEGKSCLVLFQYKCNIKKEEEIRIIGGHDSIGNWNVEKSQKLTYDSSENIWKSDENILLPQNTTIEYKYVVFRDNNLIRWEELPNNQNRKVNPENNLKILIHDKENDPKGILEKIGNKITSINTDKKIEEIPEKKIKEENDKYKDLNYESFIEDEDSEAKRHSFHGIELNDNEDQVIMVSLYLPFNGVKINDKFEIQITNDPLYHTLDKLIAKSKNVKWFGTIKNQNLLSDQEKNEISEQLKAKNMYLINYDIELFKKIQKLFIDILEPILHYQSFSPDVLDDISKFDEYWEAYLKLSQLISDTIIDYSRSFLRG